MKITYGARLPVGIEDAFAFVSDPANWPTFIEPVDSAEPGPDWGTVGGTARIVSRFLGRRTVSEVELTEWEPPTRFRYTMRTEGNPTMDNLRVFEERAEGTRLEGTTEATRRPGIGGLADWVRLRAFHRVMSQTMRTLPTAIRARRPTG